MTHPRLLLCGLAACSLLATQAGAIPSLDPQLFDKAASLGAPKWKTDFVLVEKMKIYDFPEEQISYPVVLPAGIQAESLKLLAVSGSAMRTIPFQIWPRSGNRSNLYFRTDLPMGDHRLFRLESGLPASAIEAVPAEPVTLQKTPDPHEAILSNDRLLVKVPAGRQNFPDGKPLAQVAAPILALARQASVATEQPAWMAKGSFSAPDALMVQSIEAKLIESGPVFAVYEVTYMLKEGKSYTVDLELRSREPYVSISETLGGFAPSDGALLRLDYGAGLLDPDQRLVATNGGYDPKGGAYPSRSGAYDKSAGLDGKLDFCLGLFTPNALGVHHATTIYRQGGDAMLLALEREGEWKTSSRAIWYSGDAFENIRFYIKGSEKYLTAGLSGKRRFWALALIPGEEVKQTRLPGTPRSMPAGPEVRLFNRLNDWSLNAYKDRSVDWPEKAVAAPFDQPGFDANDSFQKMSYDEYIRKYVENSGFLQWIINDSWDYSAQIGAVSFRDMPRYIGDYVVSRESWTEEQRDRVREILLFLGDCCDSDANQPHRSMMSGHPNFIMDVKAMVPIVVAAFPNHPKAKAWRDSFIGFYDDWLDSYMRKDNPDLNTKAGRWMENISCYIGQCIVSMQLAEKALVAYDGTSLGQNPKLLTLIRWMRDSMMSPQGGVRLVPPEGAHSSAMTPGGKMWNSFTQLCVDIGRDDPQLAAEMRWMETNGREGKKPDVRSSLFTDYGPVFHYDFGGSHESYAHMQDLYGKGYRWGGGSGVVYYGAKNKVWSFNTVEADGDHFNINEVSAFNVAGQGLARLPVDQLMYDFGFAQFYRQPGNPSDAYRARAMMLLRDDYLVLSDEVADPGVAGNFNWVSIYDLPQIYQLKPGATAKESVSRDSQAPMPGYPLREGKVLTYSGTGDFLTVIAPGQVKAEAQSFGAKVNGEYVFASQHPVDITQGRARFSGTYGYARPNDLALFQGNRIGLDRFELRRDGGDFGISASAVKGRISGYIVGRKGGKVMIVPPAGFDTSKALVSIQGRNVANSVENGAATFPVEIAQKDGAISYEILFQPSTK